MKLPTFKETQEKNVLEQVYVFTHDDLDGISCELLMREIEREFLETEHEVPFLYYTQYGKDLDISDQVTFSYNACSYGTIDDKVNRTLERIQQFIQTNNKLANGIKEKAHFKVILLDIHVNTHVCQFADNLLKSNPNNFSIVMIDHHDTTAKMPWLFNEKNPNMPGLRKDHIEKERRPNRNVPSSGTSLMVDFFTITDEKLVNFAEMVRKYDTWRWKELDDPVPNQFNTLFYFHGVEWYRNRMMYHYYDLGFSSDENNVLEAIERQKDRYFKKKKHEAKLLIVNERYRAAAVFADQHISELGNYLSESFQKADFVILFNYPSVSFRTAKDDIDLGAVIAQPIGGGGHAKAAGAPFNNDLFQQFIDAPLFRDIE